jgi:hypothetical protein
MSHYLNYDNPKAHEGLTIKAQPSYLKNPTLCPKCLGHGGWILQPNAYGEGIHFEAGCDQCNGYGWVDGSTTHATCIHQWKEIGGERIAQLNEHRAAHMKLVHFGNCYHIYECQTEGCGAIMAVDSSD